MKKLFILLLCLTLIGCSSTTQKEEINNNKEPEVTTSKSESVTTRPSTTTIVESNSTSVTENTNNEDKKINKDEVSTIIYEFTFQLDETKTKKSNTADIKQHIRNNVNFTEEYFNKLIETGWNWNIDIDEGIEKGVIDITIGQIVDNKYIPYEGYIFRATILGKYKGLDNSNASTTVVTTTKKEENIVKKFEVNGDTLTDPWGKTWNLIERDGKKQIWINTPEMYDEFYEYRNSNQKILDTYINNGWYGFIDTGYYKVGTIWNKIYDTYITVDGEYGPSPETISGDKFYEGIQNRGIVIIPHENETNKVRFITDADITSKEAACAVGKNSDGAMMEYCKGVDIHALYEKLNSLNN